MVMICRSNPDIWTDTPAHDAVSSYSKCYFGCAIVILYAQMSPVIRYLLRRTHGWTMAGEIAHCQKTILVHMLNE